MSELIDEIAENGNIKEVKRLIKAGVDLNVQEDHDRISALSMASIKGNIEIVKLLIDAGADLNVQDGDGETALMIASKNGHTDIVKLLIEAGADLNVQDIDVVPVLIEAGAGIEVEDYFMGYTALINAAKYGKIDIVKLLIEAGADPDITDKNGNKPKIIDEIYTVYIFPFKVKKLHAKQRLKFATMIIDSKHTDKNYDVIIKILKSLKMPTLNKDTLDKTNELLMWTLQEELQKEIEKSLKNKFSGEKLDNMIELYRKQLKKPGLSKKTRKQIKKQKKTRKNKMNIPLGSSDISSSRKSRSMNSADELDLGIKMSVMDKSHSSSRKSRSAPSRKSKSNSRKSKSNSRKSRSAPSRKSKSNSRKSK